MPESSVRAEIKQVTSTNLNPYNHKVNITGGNKSTERRGGALKTHCSSVGNGQSSGLMAPFQKAAFI